MLPTLAAASSHSVFLSIHSQYQDQPPQETGSHNRYRKVRVSTCRTRF